jgi:hypothetical protein
MRPLTLILSAVIASTVIAVDNSLILHYPLTETSGTLAVDSSGHGNHGALVGAPRLTGAEGVRLNGVDDYIRLPNDIMKGLSSMTISTQVLIRQEQTGSCFIFGLGVSSRGIGNGYVSVAGNPYRAAISTGNWIEEAESKSGGSLPRDTWKAVTYVINGTAETATLYLDGTLVAGLANDKKVVTPSRVGGGSTLASYIGRSLHSAGTPLAGSVRDFRIYDRALAAGEIAAIGIPNDAARFGAELKKRSSPVLSGLYADPNIAVFGRTYYIYPTTDGFAGWAGKDFYVWKSTNLVDWTRSARPFLTLNGASGNVPWATGNAWAPTIIKRGSKYYFYFSGHNPTYNRKTIGAAVADSPEGPFKAQPTAMILNNESVTSGQAIDPAAFRDPMTGKYYLFWGNGKPLFAELGDDMVSLKPGTIRQIGGLNNFREGQFVVYRNGLYHLTYSIDDTGSENYRVGYATATNASGPWTYRYIVLEKDPSKGILGTGHNSILNIPGTDDWYIAYHRFAIPGGGGTKRETTIDRIVFDPVTGLMRRVTPTLTSVAPQTVPA